MGARVFQPGYQDLWHTGIGMKPMHFETSRQYKSNGFGAHPCQDIQRCSFVRKTGISQAFSSLRLLQSTGKAKPRLQWHLTLEEFPYMIAPVLRGFWSGYSGFPHFIKRAHVGNTMWMLHRSILPGLLRGLGSP